VAFSRDEGLTWSNPRNLADDPLKGYHNPFAFCSSKGRVIVAYSEFSYMHVDQPPEHWTSDSPIDHLNAAIFDVGGSLDWDRRPSP